MVKYFDISSGLPMAPFNFYLPIQVRYGDLDPQWHVNNARTVTYIEQGRFAYLRALDLWDGKSFLDLPMIVADVHVSYLAPICFDMELRVGVRISRIGNKSMVFEYQIEDASGLVTTRAETVMVYYDYRTHSSAPVPVEWHKKISEFEGQEL
jgi:acyl-CoA thioester hydrolase